MRLSCVFVHSQRMVIIMIENKIKITTEYIKLDQLLKFSGVCAIGSEAKDIIAGGKVLFNGEICKMRGKKVRPGDVVIADGNKIFVE